MNFDKVQRIGKNTYLQCRERFNRSMELTGYDMYLNGAWKNYFHFGSGWEGDVDSVFSDFKKWLEDSKEIFCVYNSLIDGDPN